MDTLKVLLLVLLVLQVLDAVVISCSWTQSRLRLKNQESLRLLEELGDLIPLKCLEEGGRRFPDHVFLNLQDEDLPVVTLETFKSVARIFKNDQKSVKWDQEKLDLFKNIISSRQVENLQKCVGEDVEISSSAHSSVKALNSYFEDLEEKLRLKGHSECVWEMVRYEVLQGLKKLQAFLHSRA